MKKVRVYSFLLFAMMLIVTACAGGNNNDGGNNGAAVNTSADNVTEEQEEATPKIDLGGRTIKVAAWYDQKPAGNTAGEKARLDKLAELEKKYNLKFEFVSVPFAEYMDKFTTTMLAGEPFADIVLMELKRSLPVIKQDFVMPISEFTSATDDINNEQRLLMKLPAIGGTEYSFFYPEVSIVGMYYNRDLVKKLGVQDPQELYSAGQWNWDKFLELAKAATRDTDNDGKFDTFGYSGWAADAARHLGVTNNALFVYEDLTLGLSDPKYVETMEFVNRLFNVESVVRVKTGNKMDWGETNTFRDGDVLMSINHDWNMGGLPFEVGIVPNPAGPNFDGVHTYANTAQAGWFIPKGIKDAGLIYSIWEESFDVPPTEEYFGQEKLEGLFTNQVDIDMALQHLNGTGRLELSENIPDIPFFPVMDGIFIDNQSVTATIETHQAKAESAVANMR